MMPGLKEPVFNTMLESYISNIDKLDNEAISSGEAFPFSVLHS